MSAPDGWLESDVSQLPEPEAADVYEVLSVRRRRMAILVMAQTEGPIALGTLAEIIASAEEGEPPQSIPSDKRKAVYIGLYQAHAEKFVEAGVAEFESRSKTLIPTQLTYQVAERLSEGLALTHPAELDALNKALDAVGYGQSNAAIPTRVSLYRVPTPGEFRTLRKDAGVTQVEIAEAIGASNATISNFESGETSLGSGTLRDAVEYIRRNQKERSP